MQKPKDIVLNLEIGLRFYYQGILAFYSKMGKKALSFHKESYRYLL